MGQENDIVEENLKKYKKLINFYKIDVLPSFHEQGKNNSDLLHDVFFNTFSSNTSIVIDEINYEKISMNSNHFFGCVHRTSSIDILTEIKSKSNISLEDADVFLESSTYFYIDFSNLGMSVIKTQKIPNAYEIIQNFISNKSSLNIEIVPFKKSDEEIKQLSITSISLKFQDEDFVELKDINKNDCEFSEYTFSAKLKQVSSGFIPKLLTKFKDKPSVKKLTVSTDNEEIDLIRSIFTKQVSIELTENYKNDLDRIKNVLCSELLKIVNT